MYHFVYILTNKYDRRLYTGYSNDLLRRTYEHKNHLIKGSYTDKYNITKLVYYEVFEDYENARAREKQIKGYRRDKKLNLINKMNPNWDDLFYKMI